jgi:hypothetical protein
MGEITNLPISTKRITELDANTSIEDSDLFVTVNGGVDKNISGLVIKDEMAQVFDSLNLITSTSLADADATLTAAQLIGGEFTITPTVARTLTTDTVANIIAGLTGSVDGSNFEFTVINLADFDVTIAAGVGVTLVGNMVVKDGSATFRVKRLTSSTVSVTRLETGVFTSTPIDDLGLAPSPVVNIDSITSTGFITTSAASMGTFPSGSSKVGVLTSIVRTSTFVSQTLHDFIPDQIFTRVITNGTPAAWKRLDEPTGIISMWSGLAANVPSGYLLCDGTNGTPNLIGKFIKGSSVAGTTGGSATHTHADTFTGAAHTLTTAQMPSHTHPVAMRNGDGSTSNLISYAANGSVGYTNTVSAGGGASHTHGITGSVSSASSEPEFYTLCFIIKV